MPNFTIQKLIYRSLVQPPAVGRWLDRLGRTIRKRDFDYATGKTRAKAVLAVSRDDAEIQIAIGKLTRLKESHPGAQKALREYYCSSFQLPKTASDAELKETVRAKTMAGLEHHAAQIRAFFGLAVLDEEQIDQIFILMDKDEFDRRFNPHTDPYRPPSMVKSIHRVDPENKKVYYTLEVGGPFLLASLTHEYLHIRSVHENGVGIIDRTPDRAYLTNLLNEGLTEFLNIAYWESLSGQNSLRKICPRQYEVEIIRSLVDQHGVPVRVLADALFSGGYGAFKKAVDAKLGEGLTDWLANEFNYSVARPELPDSAQAALAVKYGPEAKIRWELIDRFWFKRAPEQHHQILLDIIDLGKYTPIETYYP